MFLSSWEERISWEIQLLFEIMSNNCVKNYEDDYKYGRKGGDLLRYAQKFWIDHFDAMMEWIFQHLNIIFTDIKGAKEELNALHQFLILLHYERSRVYSTGKPTIEKKFDYDILRWMEDAPNKKLSEFKKVVTYCFEETKFSKLSKEKVWKSLAIAACIYSGPLLQKMPKKRI